jgi:dTMP kinase
MSGRGTFVTFEGIDGAGKSTQARLLAEALRRQGRRVVETREPGGTSLGELVRGQLLHGDAIAPWAEAALFAAARAQLVEEIVRPALAQGEDVVCDRFLDSSLAYQGSARGLGIDAVRRLNEAVLDGLLPDRTFLLLLPVEDAILRSKGRRDRIEREGIAFLERVDLGYRELAEADPERIVVIDAREAPADIAERIHGELRERARTG